MTDDCCISKFLRRSGVDKKHLMRFQNKTPVFKFRRLSVDLSSYQIGCLIDRSINQSTMACYTSEHCTQPSKSTSCMLFVAFFLGKALLILEDHPGFIVSIVKEINNGT